RALFRRIRLRRVRLRRVLGLLLALVGTVFGQQVLELLAIGDLLGGMGGGLGLRGIDIVAAHDPGHGEQRPQLIELGGDGLALLGEQVDLRLRRSHIALGFGRGFLDGRLGGGSGLGNEGLCPRLAVGDDVVGLLHRIGPSLLCPLRSLLGFAVGLGSPSLRFFGGLLVLGLSLVGALLALGFGFLALCWWLEVEVVAAALLPLCPRRALLGLAVALGSPSLRFSVVLLVPGLSLVVALLALGFGFLALGCELDIEVVAGLLRGLVASLGRSEQLIGLSLRRRHGLLGFGLGLGPQIRRFLLGSRAQFGEFVVEALACFLGRGVVGLLGLIRLAFGAGLELGCALLGSL